MNTAATAAGAPRKYKRKVTSLFIHKEMQREFGFVLIALFMVSLFAIALTIHYTIQHASTGDGALQFGKISNPYEVISQVSYLIMMRITIILLVTLTTIGIYGIKFLHRIAGPVYRFRRTLIMLNRGEIPDRIRLRSGDFFQEVAEEINRQTEMWLSELRMKEDLLKQLDVVTASISSTEERSKIESLKKFIK